MSESPICPHCNRRLEVHSAWSRANFCRALVLMPWIKEYPGLSSWEMAQKSGMAYSQVSKGLAKLRDLEVVRADAEEREAGGWRYRYYPWPDHEQHLQRLLAMLRPGFDKIAGELQRL